MHKQLVDGLVFETSHHALLNINAGFHQMLADFSGNRYFSDIIRQHNRRRRFTESGAVLYPERMLQSCQEHLGISSRGSWGARITSMFPEQKKTSCISI